MIRPKIGRRGTRGRKRRYGEYAFRRAYSGIVGRIHHPAGAWAEGTSSIPTFESLRLRQFSLEPAEMRACHFPMSLPMPFAASVSPIPPSLLPPRTAGAYPSLGTGSMRILHDSGVSMRNDSSMLQASMRVSSPGSHETGGTGLLILEGGGTGLCIEPSAKS